MFIGKRLKELRKTKKLTLSELAQKTGIQLATLSRIENMKMTGTLESHMKIAQALEVNITDLYADILPTRSETQVKTPEDQGDVFVHSEKSSYEILTSKVMSRKMMPTLIKIEPQGQTNLEQNKPGTEKFVFVLEGEIKAYIKEESFALSRQHSLYFDASLPHYFVNSGGGVARAVCVVSPVAL